MKYFLVVFLSALSWGVWAQAKADCDDALGKKTKKKLDAYLKSSKSDKFQDLWDAYRSDEDCVPCKFYLGVESFREAKTKKTMDFDKAYEYFQAVHQSCPFYHSDLYYYMGFIAFEYAEYGYAAEYWSLFLDFPESADDDQFSKMYTRRVEEVEKKMYYVSAMAELIENQVPFDPIKIEDVSTGKDEYLPMLSPDNQVLYFTSRYTKKGMGIADMSREVEELSEAFVKDYKFPGQFEGVRRMMPPFNTGDSYGGNSLALNNKDMYVTICIPTQVTQEGKVFDYLNCDIYETHWNGYQWSKPENLGPEVNNELGWESQPSISSDGQMLIFAKHQENLTQGLDLYYTVKDDRGKWQKARPLSPKINTAGNEKSPFLHSDSKTLYFSYQAPQFEGGFPKEGDRVAIGGYDIYYTRYDVETEDWLEPVNIGFPINTGDDDLGLIVSTDGKTAYFASNRFSDAEGWDLYKFDLYRKARPQKIVLVRGQLKDDYGKPITDASVIIKNLKDNSTQKIIVDEEDGTYTRVVEVSKEDEYIVSIQQKNKSFAARTVTLEDTLYNSVAQKSMKVARIEVGQTYKIDDLNYSTNSADLDHKAILILNEFATFLNANPNLNIAIHGHTDNIGDESENIKLSEERAKGVRAYLISKGVSGARLTFKGFGSSKPLSSNESIEGRLQNRRTEFVILSK